MTRPRPTPPPTQSWDPSSYAEHARFVSDLGQDLLTLLAPESGERLLDLGCGDGALTQRLVDAGCRVVAIDSSLEQVIAARARGLDAHVLDAASLPFEEEFDAVFSNAVLHWIRDVDGVLRAVHRALRPGGRFVGELGGAGNVAAIRAALTAALRERDLEADALNPWIFPTAADYRVHLEACGFEVEVIELFDRPTLLPGSLGDWLATFAQPFLAPLDATEREQVIEQVTNALRSSLHRDGRWVADYVRLRFRSRRRP